MPTSKLTSKGQITIPKPIRDLLGIKPGDRVAFRIQADGGVMMEATINLLSLRGRLKPGRAGVLIEDMNAAIRSGVDC